MNTESAPEAVSRDELIDTRAALRLRSPFATARMLDRAPLDPRRGPSDSNTDAREDRMDMRDDRWDTDLEKQRLERA